MVNSGFATIFALNELRTYYLSPHFIALLVSITFCKNLSYEFVLILNDTIPRHCSFPTSNVNLTFTFFSLDSYKFIIYVFLLFLNLINSKNVPSRRITLNMFISSFFLILFLQKSAAFHFN